MSFIVVGENIHTTRVIRQSSPRFVASPAPSIAFTTAEDERLLLPVPEQEQRGQDYAEGRVKHVRSAVRVAMEGNEVGARYLQELAVEQIRAGAAFLDVNVDEYSYKLAEQIEAMEFLVGLLAGVSSVPLSIDSSNQEILEAGVAEALRRGAGAPMLNSASLERLEALDVAKEAGGPVVVTAAGSSGMPTDAPERVENASRMIDAAHDRGIDLDLIYVDPLMFPISVDGDFGHHVLDAIRMLRERYGPEIHITGGMSNVSFGLPNRRLINDAFLMLAIDAGADSGILDPMQNDIGRLADIDRAATPYRLAFDVLSGADRHCRAYIKASRAGELALHSNASA